MEKKIEPTIDEHIASFKVNRPELKVYEERARQKIYPLIQPEEVKADDEHKGITNFNSYRYWVSISSSPILSSKRFYIGSDGEKYDIAWIKLFLLKKIEHLPEKEQRKIEAYKDAYYYVLNLANTYKRKAFKVSAGGNNPNSNDSILNGRKADLIDLFGRAYTLEEALKIVNEVWNFPCSVDALKTFRRKNLEAISIKIEEYKKSHTEVRLIMKRSRLDELTSLFNHRKELYNQSNSRDDYRLLLSTLEQIRREAEGERVVIEGGIELNIQKTVDNHLQNEIFKTLPLREIIIARVCARMRLEPKKLLKDLNDSYYSKFNRFLNANAQDAEVEQVYPSQMGYDFDKITTAYYENEKNEQEERQQEKNLIEIKADETEKETEKAIEAKALFKEMLKNRKVKTTSKSLEMSYEEEEYNMENKGVDKRYRRLNKKGGIKKSTKEGGRKGTG